MSALKGIVSGTLWKTRKCLSCVVQKRLWGFPGSSDVKSLPEMWGTWVRSLAQEDPLEEGMATHSSSLAWRVAWTEEPGGLQFMGSQQLDTTE